MKTLLKALITAVMGFSVLALVPAGPAGAQADGYTPCDGQEHIDVLIMMDASGSLNSPRSGIDPGGTRRVSALTRFRSELDTLLSSSGTDVPVSVRIGLWRFESTAEEITPFGTPSAAYPSDADIRASLGNRRADGTLSYRQNHTNYLAGLDSAYDELVNDGHPDACRLLIFFTDGLHDPTGDLTAEQIEQLRNEVCYRIKPAYERAGINTYAVLLGLQRGAGETGAVREEMRTATMQVLRALTGDSEAPLVAGIPYSGAIQCREFSDEQPEDRSGAISGVGGLDGLSLELLKAVDVAANNLVEWVNCGTDGHTSGTSSVPLPAGHYIDEIVAYPQGGGTRITGFETTDENGAMLDSGSHNGDGYMRLDRETFGEYGAGWRLEFGTEPDGDLGVECFVQHAQTERTLSEGIVVGPEGTAVSGIERSAMGADSGPLELEIEAVAPVGLCEAEAFEWPDPRVRDWYCHDGNVIFDLDPLECQDTLDTSPLVATYEPPHAEAIYGQGQFIVEARVVLDGANSVLYDCFGGPALECKPDSAAVVEPDQPDLPREPLSAAVECTLYPPERGEVSLRAEWLKDADGHEGPHAIDWLFDEDYHNGGGLGSVSEDGITLVLGADATAGVSLRFTTGEELENGDWAIAGRIALVPSWDPGHTSISAEAVAMTQEMATEVRVDAQYRARSNSAAARWITLALLAASIILSYILLCLALVNSMTLPDPSKFWMRHSDMSVSKGGGPRGRSAISDTDAGALTGSAASVIRGTRSRRGKGKRFVRWQSEGLTLRLRRSMWLWLPGLIKHGAWASVESSTKRPIAVRPKPKRKKKKTRTGRALTTARFTRLEAVARTSEDQASAWVATPRTGRQSELVQVDGRGLSGLLEEADSAQEDHSK